MASTTRKNGADETCKKEAADDLDIKIIDR